MCFLAQDFPTLEHHYMSVIPYTKEDDGFAQEMQQATDGFAAKRLGREYKDKLTKGEREKYNPFMRFIMLALMEAKFLNTDKEQLLLDTGEQQLWEATTDTFWGVGMLEGPINARALPRRAWMNTVHNVTGACLEEVRDLIKGRRDHLGAEVLVFTDSQGIRVRSRCPHLGNSRKSLILPFSGGTWAILFRLAMFCTNSTVKKVIFMVGTNDLVDRTGRKGGMRRGKNGKFIPRTMVNGVSAQKGRKIGSLMHDFGSELAKFVQFNGGIPVVICDIPKRYDALNEGNWNRHIGRVNEAMQEETEKLGASFVNLYDVIRPEMITRRYHDGALDGIHLNPRGASVVGEILQPIITARN